MTRRVFIFGRVPRNLAQNEGPWHTLDSGYKKSLTDSSYLTINCLFNDTNYWLNLSGRALKRTGRTLDLSNQRVWLKLVQDLYKPKANGATKVRTE